MPPSAFELLIEPVATAPTASIPQARCGQSQSGVAVENFLRSSPRYSTCVLNVWVSKVAIDGLTGE